MFKRIAIALVVTALSSVTHSAQSLGEMATEAGLDWMAGQWQGNDDNGDPILLAFGSDLDKHIGTLHFKDSHSESKGITILDPVSHEAKYYSGNNQGDMGTGVWSAKEGKATLKYKQTTADGTTSRMGFTFAKQDTNTMEVKLYELSASDELTGEPRWTKKFQRKK